jgi:TolB protein
MTRITSIAGSVLVVLAVWVAAGHSPASQVPRPIHETVVYSSIQPENWDLYIFDQPGATPRRLTTDPGLDYNPAISPDGRWIVFTSERNGSPDLYALDLQNPAMPRQLTKSPAMEDAAAFSPDGRRLLFVSTESGNPDIWVMPFAPEDPDAAAGKATNLTRHPAGDYQPAFSPDGQWIAFSSNRDTPGAQPTSAGVPGTYQASDVYVMHADGTGVQRLTRHEGWDGSPAWTPDGQAIVFYSEQDGEPRIFRMNRDGSASQATSATGEPALSPTFTPSGRLSFTARRNGRWTIVSTRPDGSDLRVESDTARDYWAPAYDPSSGRLVCYGAGPTDETSRFESDLPGPFLAHAPRQVDLPDRTLSLYAVRGYIPALSPDGSEVATSEAFARLVISRLDGSHKRTIFDRVKTERYRGENSAWGPTWSADGAWLAFGVGAPFGKGSAKVDIWKSRPDGSQAVNLTSDSSANDAWPDFSPDGRRIVFRSARDGNQEIYLMNADGTGVRRLTWHEATDTMPAFSSRGDRIAFTSQRDGDYEIYILQLNADGSPGQLERVTNSPGRDMHPRFSPDDKWLLFTSQRGGLNDELPLLRVIFLPQPYGELHAIRLEDKAVFRLTHDKWEDGPSAWKR